jgi:hypothetical protein
MGGFRRSPAAVVANELTALDLGLLGDVDGTIAPSDGEILKWNDSTKKWAPASDDERNTASNIGTFGSGLFKQKTGENLEFKNISSGSTKISIASGTDHVNIDVVSANINTADLNNDANFGIVAGTNTQLQFNNSTELGASANLTWDGAQLEVTGNIAVDGTIIANQFHVTYVTSSVLFQSGSSIFGDTSDDTHQFSGSIYAANSLTASAISSTFTGDGTSVANVDALQLNSQAPSFYLDFTNHVVDDNEISGDKVHGGSISGVNQLTASYSNLGTSIATALSASSTVTANAFTGDGSSVTSVDASQLNSQAPSYYLDASNVNAGTLGNTRLPTTISQSEISASSGVSGSLGQFTSLQVNSSTLVSNLNADKLDSQEGSYYLDFTNQIVDDNEISGNKVHGGSISALQQLTASYSSLGEAITTQLSSSGTISASAFHGDGSNLTGVGGAGHTVQNAGSSLTARTYLNFTGTGVATTDDVGSDTTIVTISVGSGSGQTNTTSNEGSGIGLAMTKENSNLPFKTFLAGDNISLVTGSNTITIAYEPPSADLGVAPDPNFTVGTRILGSTGMDFVAGGITRLFISGSGYLGVGVTGSSTTHRLTLPNISTGNDGKAVAHAWATYSSRRYKENVETINDPIGIVKGLRGVNFRWKDSKKKDVGFIAEEVGKVLPAIVEYEEDGINAQSMDYARLTSILVEAVKSQQRQIDEILEIIKK